MAPSPGAELVFRSRPGSWQVSDDNGKIVRESSEFLPNNQARDGSQAIYFLANPAAASIVWQDLDAQFEAGRTYTFWALLGRSLSSNEEGVVILQFRDQTDDKGEA